MFLSAFTALQLVIYSLNNREKIYFKGLCGISLSVFIYSLFYSFELISPNVDYMLLFILIERIGALLLVNFWVIMALQYTNKSKFLTKNFYILLFMVPILLIVMNATDEYFHLFYKGYSLTKYGALSIANIDAGLGDKLSTAYITCMFSLGNVLYFIFFTKNTIYKKRSFIIMITSMIPWIGFCIYTLDLLPISIDPNPFFLAIACYIFTRVLINNNLFDMSGIARHIVFDNIKQIVIVLDMYNRIIDINKQTEKILGKKASLVIGENIFKVYTNLDQIKQYLCLPKEATFNFKTDISKKHYYFMGEINFIKNKSGKILILKDNTEQILMIKKLQYYACMDILTGVYNRNHFYTIANEKVSHCLKNNYSISFIMFDLDKFKNINDTYGHAAGDLILKNVTTLCKNHLPKSSLIGRYGGEEFIILIENLEGKRVLELIESLRMIIMNSNNLYENKILKVTCSFGIFTTTVPTKLESMIKTADEALYNSKNTGRNKSTLILDD